MYSDALKTESATVRMMPHTPVLVRLYLVRMTVREKQVIQTYNTPRLRPQAMVIFSFRFIFSFQRTNHGRMAKEKSAATNHAGRKVSSLAF